MSLLQQAKVRVSLERANAVAALDQSVRVGIINSVTQQLEAAAWRELVQVWNEKIVRLWIFKTIRVRDLRAVWVRLFGEPPSDVVGKIGGAS